MGGSPVELQPVVDRLGHGARQLYALAYADLDRRTSQSGDDLAAELAFLAEIIIPKSRLTVVAHSMGGIVARRALCRMTHDGAIARYAAADVIAVDTPWHGFPGPADDGAGAAAMFFAAPFLPDGMEDMRALSSLFRGAPESADPVERAGLYGLVLPDHVSFDLVFAESGVLVWDNVLPALTSLPERLAAHFTYEHPVVDRECDPRLANHWRAVISSRRFYGFHLECESLAGAGRLTPGRIARLLDAHFPRFPGTHDTILQEHPDKATFLDWLTTRLAEI